MELQRFPSHPQDTKYCKIQVGTLARCGTSRYLVEVYRYQFLPILPIPDTCRTNFANTDIDTDIVHVCLTFNKKFCVCMNGCMDTNVKKIKQPIYNHLHVSEGSCLKTAAFLPCQCLDAFFCQSQYFQQC